MHLYFFAKCRCKTLKILNILFTVFNCNSDDEHKYCLKYALKIHNEIRIKQGKICSELCFVLLQNMRWPPLR